MRSWGRTRTRLSQDRGALAELGRGPARKALQHLEAELEHGVGVAGRGPDPRVPGEGEVDQSDKRCGMAHRRDAADRETGVLAHEGRARHLDRLAGQRREPGGVDAVRAACHHQQRHA